MYIYVYICIHIYIHTHVDIYMINIWYDSPLCKTDFLIVCIKFPALLFLV